MMYGTTERTARLCLNYIVGGSALCRLMMYGTTERTARLA